MRWSWLPFVLLLALEGRAFAEDKAAAAALYDEGVALMKANDYPRACAKFRDSIAASPAGLGAMLWLGDCYQKNGQTASAWAQFRQAAALAAEKNDPREKVATRRVEELEPDLARLTIVVVKSGAPPGVEVTVTRDGALLSSASFGVPIPIDPGDHVIAASAKDHRTWTTKVTVNVHGTAEIVVPALEAAPTPTPTPTDLPPPPGDRGRGDSQRVIGLGVGGLGVLAVGVGAFFGLRASSKLDESNDGHCKDPGDMCDARGLALRSEATDAATVSTIAIGVGAAAIVAGAVLFFTAPRSSRSAAGWRLRVDHHLGVNW